jgi:hypothetical protein
MFQATRVSAGIVERGVRAEGIVSTLLPTML